MSACHYAEKVTPEAVAAAAEAQARDEDSLAAANAAARLDDTVPPDGGPTDDGAGGTVGRLRGASARSAGVLLRGGRGKKSK